MKNINESLEQRIDQMKALRDLGINLRRTGMDNELESEHLDAFRKEKDMMNIQSNTVLKWADHVDVTLKELDNSIRQSSD